MMRRSRFAMTACVLSVAGLLAACGSESLPTEPPPPAAGPALDQAPPTVPDTSTGTGDGPTTALAITRSDELGNIVTDQNGRVLYRFEKDETDPPKSNCSGQCATTWPPALVLPGKGVELRGVDSSLVNTVKRSDGREQLTLAGRPLYRYSKDKAPGQTEGHRRSSTWFAVTPIGQKAVAASLEGAALVATPSDQLGTMVVDADGYTMYRFDGDVVDPTKPSKSKCVGACAVKWPPAIVTEDNPIVDGIDESLVSTILRADGARQLTIGGWPIYGYNQDKVSGDIKGQGVDNLWFAVSPTGKKAGT